MYPIILCIHINKSKLKFIEMTLCWASNKYLAHHHSFFLFRSSISKVYYNLDTQFAGLIFLASFVWKVEVTQTFSFIKNLAPDIWSYVGYYLYIVIVCYSWLKDCPPTKAGQFEENVFCVLLIFEKTAIPFKQFLCLCKQLVSLLIFWLHNIRIREIKRKIKEIKKKL